MAQVDAFNAVILNQARTAIEFESFERKTHGFSLKEKTLMLKDAQARVALIKTETDRSVQWIKQSATGKDWWKSVDGWLWKVGQGVWAERLTRIEEGLKRVVSTSSQVYAIFADTLPGAVNESDEDVIDACEFVRGHQAAKPIILATIADRFLNKRAYHKA